MEITIIAIIQTEMGRITIPKEEIMSLITATITLTTTMVIKVIQDRTKDKLHHYLNLLLK